MNICDASQINNGGGNVKQAADLYTRDLIDKPKRGRPRKPDALTPAQRAKRYRDKRKRRPIDAAEMNRIGEFSSQLANLANDPRNSQFAVWHFPRRGP